MKPLRCLAVLSLLALFIAPPTRRAAFEQTRPVLGLTPPQAFLFPSSSFHPNPADLERRSAEDYRRAAARHPDDIGLQMAAPVASLEFSFTEFDKGVVAGLRPVLAAHPNSPAIYAQLLLYGSACLGYVGDEYKAAKPEFQPLRDAIDPKPAHPSPRVSFADYLSWAAAGERLDPDNAFFPAIRTVCLFKMGRKQEAIDSLERSGSKHRWEDYGALPAKGVYDLPREAYGRTDPMAMASSGMFTIGMPMYAGMREVAHTALEDAQAMERAGHPEEGLRIRRDLWRMGATWRGQSRDIIGALTASAIGSMALGELGGKVVINPKWPNEKKRQVRRDAALAYLRRTGHAEDADWLRADMTKTDDMRDIISQGLERADIVGTMTKAMFSWCGAAVLLNAAMWLMLMGLMRAWVRRADTGRARRLLTAVAVATALLAWQGRAQQGWLATTPVSGIPLPVLAWLACAVGALDVPIVLAVLFGLTALVRRKPFRKKTGAWLRGSLIPAACIVTLLFVGVSVWSVKPQRALREYINGQITHEGQYYAHLVGKTWPE